MSKGSKQRKPQVPDSQVNANWETIFSNNQYREEDWDSHDEYLRAVKMATRETLKYRNKK